MRVSRFYANFIAPTVIVLGLALCALGATAALPAVPATVDSITPTELKMHLSFLASEELGGRYTLAPNFAISARYLASHLEAYGFKPGGEHGSFFQTFEVISAKAEPANTYLELTAGGKTTRLNFGEVFTYDSTASGEAQGSVVYVGSGISCPSQNHDDYAGLDVKGKIVLLVDSPPPGIDISKVADDEKGAEGAQKHGAVGVLRVLSPFFLNFLERTAATREERSLARKATKTVPSLALGREAAEKLLAMAGTSSKAIHDAKANKEQLHPKALDASAKISISISQTRTTTQNVIGILEGSDPVLKNEYVAFSAHYDHLKTGAHGEVYPGADDDGSGTTAVLTIAHAMSLNPPKRSVLAIFHAGEEIGLLGSEYNADFGSPVPLDKILVDLNIDMIGRSKLANDKDPADSLLTDANSIYLVGSNRISPELHEISEDTNAEFQKMKFDYHYNDPNDPERIYFRSDHWNYAKHGVPVIFYFDGTSVDYHKPTDTVDKIDFNKLTRVTRLVFETGWRIANLGHRLTKAS